MSNAKCTSLSSSFTSLASHKLGRRNASQTLRARCVVGGGGELVVRYGTSMVGKVMAIVWLLLGRKVCAIGVIFIFLPQIVQ